MDAFPPVTGAQWRPHHAHTGRLLGSTGIKTCDAASISPCSFIYVHIIDIQSMCLSDVNGEAEAICCFVSFK
jgi:hypothetical protein